MNKNSLFCMSEIKTPLGVMVAIGNDQGLYLLEFADQAKLSINIKRLKATVVAGWSKATISMKDELERYFTSQLQTFTTPLFLTGTPFQNAVWQTLQKIPYGHTRSYKEIAIELGKPTAFRAVAQANAANMLSIIIPCHRVINSDQKMGGYSGGLARKEWLLTHEMKSPGERYV